MKLMNIADEGAQYKWQLYDLYDKAFPEQEKKPLQVMEQLAADGKMERQYTATHGKTLALPCILMTSGSALLTRLIR